MLERAAREHSLDLARSFVVGDRYGDMELAQRAGAKSILVRTGYGEGELAWHSAKWPSQPDFVAEDLSESGRLDPEATSMKRSPAQKTASQSVDLLALAEFVEQFSSKTDCPAWRLRRR